MFSTKRAKFSVPQSQYYRMYPKRLPVDQANTKDLFTAMINGNAEEATQVLARTNFRIHPNFKSGKYDLIMAVAKCNNVSVAETVLGQYDCHSKMESLNEGERNAVKAVLQSHLTKNEALAKLLRC